MMVARWAARRTAETSAGTSRRFPPRYTTFLSLALLAGVGLHELFGWWWAELVGALAMLPVILKACALV